VKAGEKCTCNLLHTQKRMGAKNLYFGINLVWFEKNATILKVFSLAKADTIFANFC